MTDYQLIKQLVGEMKVGEVRTIEMPSNLKVFRSHLSMMGMGEFPTKTTINGKLSIARVKKEQIWDKLK